QNACCCFSRQAHMASVTALLLRGGLILHVVIVVVIVVVVVVVVIDVVVIVVVVVVRTRLYCMAEFSCSSKPSLLEGCCLERVVRARKELWGGLGWSMQGSSWDSLHFSCPNRGDSGVQHLDSGTS
ncbi:unnamed protein product, partial [Polarella glacialis]